MRYGLWPMICLVPLFLTTMEATCMVRLYFQLNFHNFPLRARREMAYAINITTNTSESFDGRPSYEGGKWKMGGENGCGKWGVWKIDWGKL